MPPAHPLIEEFIVAISSLPVPDGVGYWVVSDTYRGPAAQEAALAAGTSNAHYGQSSHNVYDPSEGWQGAAVDVYPIVAGTSDVSTDPAHYIPIAELAEEMGLENLGALYGWDWAHNQIPDWQDYPVVPAAGYPKATSAGGLMLLVLVAFAASQT